MWKAWGRLLPNSIRKKTFHLHLNMLSMYLNIETLTSNLGTLYIACNCLDNSCEVSAVFRQIWVVLNFAVLHKKKSSSKMSQIYGLFKNSHDGYLLKKFCKKLSFMSVTTFLLLSKRTFSATKSMIDLRTPGHELSALKGNKYFWSAALWIYCPPPTMGNYIKITWSKLINSDVIILWTSS